MTDAQFLVRFLGWVPSDHPDWPFQPGQVIPVASITAQVLGWITPRPDGTRQATLYKQVEPDEAGQ